MILDDGKLKMAFYRAKYGNNVDKLINLFSGRLGFSHSELVFGDGMSFSSTTRDESETPTGRHKKNGTRFKLIDFEPEKWAIREVYVTEAEQFIIKTYCETLLEAGYDFGAVLHRVPVMGAFFRNSVFDYFCTESNVEPLQHIGRFNHVTADMATPNNMAWFLNVDDLRLKYPNWRG